jgi:hypothetical protein
MTMIMYMSIPAVALIGAAILIRKVKKPNRDVSLFREHELKQAH